MIGEYCAAELFNGQHHINLLDIGCHKAHFLDYFQGILNRPINSFGIDAIDYGVGGRYSFFLKKAVDDIETPQIKKFNKYIEPGCNSLLEMRRDIIVHERDKKGWYVGWDIESVHEQEDVECDSIKNILDKHYIWHDELIDYVKIDTQGNDINVVKSFKEYLDKVKYIQIEAVSSHDKDVTLYKGQTIMEEDIEIMKSLGFVPIFIQDYAIVTRASPEADIIFKNTKF